MITQNQQKKTLVEQLLKEDKLTLDQALVLLEDSDPVGGSVPVYPFYPPQNPYPYPPEGPWYVRDHSILSPTITWKDPLTTITVQPLTTTYVQYDPNIPYTLTVGCN